VARWQEGVALASRSRLRSVQAVVRANVRWVAREVGSGARQCLDELLHRRSMPRRLARDHRGVADAVRCGWADAGVCLRLVCEEAGLHFLAVRQEVYEWCFRADSEADPRIRALKDAVRSSSYRRVLSELPGYDSRECGELESVHD
jgi:putative molybdopterin biosynthesis protein